MEGREKEDKNQLRILCLVLYKIFELVTLLRRFYSTHQFIKKQILSESCRLTMEIKLLHSTELIFTVYSSNGPNGKFLNVTPGIQK